ncbi:MAG: methylthioadenosine phosphorylase [Acidobacteria bacterium RIFCSPHIGHO2_02_FULL_67_57]|nr:MAG: methylthioadenosine phosphorylase [Acidobacteria bacterium RIFCSPHIGHO2_02_FULL_67_57]OFV85556.1 MAG: methylthioadenosine phosphorylase [Acidobacteria bacterium RIFCSPHIGHO2_01_FULL_67_28]
MPGLAATREVRVATPFGKPSDAYLVGTLAGKRVAFLARHGRGHRILPTELNFRANLYGFKKLGVECILSVSAVGSLKEEYKPMDFLVPDQFFDRTRQRVSTFFGNGIVAHVSFADPFCPALRQVLMEACRRAGVTVHDGGTYVCMEGPMFSTKAESHTYRKLGFDVIGMTNLQEAKLAREAEICYATVAMVTDYDCWHPEHDAVTGQQVMEYLARNIKNVQGVIREAVPRVPVARSCKCGAALAHSIITEAKKIPPSTRKRLQLIIGKYLR